MAIFVIEDDAQNGPDHVDAHRTIGSVISLLGSRLTVSITRSTPRPGTTCTDGADLGLPPMTQYDAAATPMFRCFTNDLTFTKHQVLQPKIDLLAKNTPSSPGAKQSAMMDFDEYDEAPEDELNRILWAGSQGEHTPYPVPIHRVLFTE